MLLSMPTTQTLSSSRRQKSRRKRPRLLTSHSLDTSHQFEGTVRPRGGGGGVAIWIRADLVFTELECIDTGGNEILWVRLKTAAGPSIGVCAVYRSGSSADGDISALNSISSGIDDARQCCQNIIVAGDLNVHNREWLGSSRTSPAGEAAEDLCYHHCLDQHVHEPTRGNKYPRPHNVRYPREASSQLSIHL